MNPKDKSSIQVSIKIFRVVCTLTSKQPFVGQIIISAVLTSFSITKKRKTTQKIEKYMKKHLGFSPKCFHTSKLRSCRSLGVNQHIGAASQCF